MIDIEVTNELEFVEFEIDSQKQKTKKKPIASYGVSAEHLKRIKLLKMGYLKVDNTPISYNFLLEYNRFLDSL